MMKLFCSVIAGLSVAMCYSDNVEPLDIQEERKVKMLECLQWHDSLLVAEMSEITNLITSSKHALSESALCVAIAQEIPNLRSVLQMGAERGTFYTRVLSKSVLAGIQNGDSPIRALTRTNVLAANSTNTDIVATMKAGHIAAVFIAKKIRSGDSFANGLEDFTMTGFDQKLIQYSKIPATQAVDLIIGKIVNAKIADSDAYDLVRVLSSYGGTIQARMLIDAYSCGEVKDVGKVLLLRAMEDLATSFCMDDLLLTKKFLTKSNAMNMKLMNVVECVLKVVQDEISFRNASLTRSLKMQVLSKGPRNFGIRGDK